MKKITFLALAAVLSLGAAAQTEGFVTKALNDDGEPTFDWSKASAFVPILVSETVSEALNTDIALDMRPNDTNIHLWVWNETYVGCDDNSGMNSFGQLEDHFAMTVSNKGWSGLGIIKDGANDFSFIDDTYVLHLAIKGNPVQSHGFGLGSIPFALGETAVYAGDPAVLVKNLGTWPNDGEWYYVDVPVKELKKLGDELFSSNTGGASAFTDNFFWIVSGGTQGNELHIDNVFLYKDSTIEPELLTGDVNRDGKVNVSDVTALINMILGTLEKDWESADVNKDEKINVSDVTALINIILGVAK